MYERQSLLFYFYGVLASQHASAMLATAYQLVILHRALLVGTAPGMLRQSECSWRMAI